MHSADLQYCIEHDLLNELISEMTQSSFLAPLFGSTRPIVARIRFRRELSDAERYATDGRVQVRPAPDISGARPDPYSAPYPDGERHRAPQGRSASPRSDRHPKSRRR